MPTFPYVSADAVTALVAGQMHVDPAALTDGRNDWPTLVNRAVVAAANDVRARYLKAGYALATIEASNQLIPYTTDQAAFWTFTWGGLAGQIPQTTLRAMDRREELDKLPFLTVLGAIQAPALGDSPVGGVEIGTNRHADHTRHRYDRRFGETRPRFDEWNEGDVQW